MSPLEMEDPLDRAESLVNRGSSQAALALAVIDIARSQREPAICPDCSRAKCE